MLVLNFSRDRFFDSLFSLHGAMYKEHCEKAYNCFPYRACLSESYMVLQILTFSPDFYIIGKNVYGKEGDTIIIQSQFIYS